jgi:hypothetical protein
MRGSKWATDFTTNNYRLWATVQETKTQITRGNEKWLGMTIKKAQAVSMYEEAEPTPETSMEIVKDIAEELDESPNGVRMILTKAGVYVKKTPAAKSSGSTTGGGGTRVSKAAAAEALIAALGDAGQDVDEEIIAKLTGKASQYFTSIITKINEA